MMITLFFTFPSPLNALSSEQKKLYNQNILYYDLESCEGGADGSFEETGNNEKDVWNYFKAKGLEDHLVAGIMGNMAHESGFDPENIQDPAGRTKDPSSTPSGWGLIQWTPGSKVIGLAKEAGLDGKIYELSTQLDLVWAHMNNKPVVTQPFSLSYYKKIESVKEATSYWQIKSKYKFFGVQTERISVR